MEKIGKLNQDIWDIIIKHSELTSVTNLARAGRRFNNYVGLDFHKLCVVNHIFRLPGESWADAFADAHRRLWIVAESFTDEVLYLRRMVWFNDTYVYELATGRPLFTQARKRMTFNSSVFKYHTFENIVEEVLSTKTTFMDNMRELEHTTEHYCARVVQDKLLVYDVSKGVQYELPLNPSFGKVRSVLFFGSLQLCFD
ncbi:unnamed protein product [Bursaphelenchus okinawaensis]|uniref:Uncharacterized protein n=1 Tax=Bursaphelenchus okinawaensis TaxID=465554 RepID=A0A811L254_9BILA|nr:unnamed protein product [Bursaphelenchus okinawaensis]CAG9114759.1 unnamed protein product [Bursaphelenchus okinawaensis]